MINTIKLERSQFSQVSDIPRDYRLYKQDWQACIESIDGWKSEFGTGVVPYNRKDDQTLTSFRECPT